MNTIITIDAKTVTFQGKNTWIWGEGDSWDTGGPYRLHDINCEGGLDDSIWYVFSPADSYFPPCWAVRAMSLQDAYEVLLDWKTDYFRIDHTDYSEFGIDTDNPRCDFTPNGGVPVDTEGLQLVDEVRIVSIVSV